MGRRKRRNSDVDLTVETVFDHHRRQQDRTTTTTTQRDDNDVEPPEEESPTEPTDATKRENDDSKSTSSESNPIHKKQRIQTEEERIEALKKKKQERKQRRKEKKEEQQHKANEARKQESAAKELEKKKEQEAKKQAAEASKDKPFTTIQKGVQYQDVIVGKGPPVVDRKKVRVAYTLRAKQRYGKVLDSSADFGFRLGRGDVISGWDIGLQGMRQGGKRYLIIPPQAGYGQQNVGAGPGGILFFEVTVLAC
jgi:FKBP-type peptidyl-prolyl cis-trans isomerase